VKHLDCCYHNLSSFVVKIDSNKFCKKSCLGIPSKPIMIIYKLLSMNTTRNPNPTVTAKALIALVARIGTMKRPEHWSNNYSSVLEATEFVPISSLVKLRKIREEQLHFWEYSRREKKLFLTAPSLVCLAPAVKYSHWPYMFWFSWQALGWVFILWIIVRRRQHWYAVSHN